VIAQAPYAGGNVPPPADFGTVDFTGAEVNGSPLGAYRPG
jgi:hypothetical protein